MLARNLRRRLQRLGASGRDRSVRSRAGLRRSGPQFQASSPIHRRDFIGPHQQFTLHPKPV
jgi:hypothetical protein